MKEQTILLGALFDLLEKEAGVNIAQDKQAPKTGEWFAETVVGMLGPYKTPIHAIVGLVDTLIRQHKQLEEHQNKWCELAYKLTAECNDALLKEAYNVSSQAE
jgi:hypothetical protein